MTDRRKLDFNDIVSRATPEMTFGEVAEEVYEFYRSTMNLVFDEDEHTTPWKDLDAREQGAWIGVVALSSAIVAKGVKDKDKP